jgi:NAD-dependent deacetylase
VKEAADRLRRARRVVALTGAGVSAASGLPTFRQPQTGLWARFRPEDLATPEAFRRDPALVWRWYAMRRALVAAAAPNPAHHALVRLQRCVDGFTLVTQNVDGLHTRAGSTGVLELHGSIARTRCSDGRCAAVVDARGLTGEPPACPGCGALLRPDVVWFGEPLPAAVLDAAARAAADCDVFLSIGTSGLVFPAAALLPVALRAGAGVIVINPDPQPLPAGADVHHLAAPAAEALPALLAAAFGDRP